MKVITESKVHIYEVNDNETLGSSSNIQLRVKSHWNVGYLVVLQFPRGKKYTLSAPELIQAIHKASGG